MTLVPKNAIAAILIVTILISVIGTWAALSSLGSTGYREVPVKEDLSIASGKVTLNLVNPPEPPVAIGEVKLNLV